MGVLTKHSVSHHIRFVTDHKDRMDPRLKKLRIATGVVKRCGKEKLSYRKEADMQREKIEKMKVEGKEEADIKKMNECMQESLMMIPDSHRRLEKAINELKPLYEELE